MVPLLALFGAGLLLFGLYEVWRARWQPLWVALGFTALFVLVCFTSEQWYSWFGMSRGDGFIIIGYFMVGGISAMAGIGALILAPIVAALGRRRAKLLAKD
jgi:hypothetical protein